MITASNITKKFGGEIALSHISFSLPEIGVVGFLGPNGAGKTTLLRLLAQLETPTEGTLNINGEITHKPLVQFKSQIGYVAESIDLYPHLTVLEQLILRGELFGLSPHTLIQNVNHVLKMCQLESVVDKKCAHLSKGYRQRTGLALSLIHNPHILILDEPTEGLDPLQILELRKLIQTLGQTRLVLLSSHILSEIIEVCQTIYVLNKGKIEHQGTVSDLGGSRESIEKLFWELKNE